MIVRSVEDLRTVVAKKARSQEFYRAAVLGNPWSFSCPLHPPVKTAEFLSAWPEVRAWAQAWLGPSPYWAVETTVRQIGRGTRVGQSTLPHFPSRVCIASVEQALAFLREEKAFQDYVHAVRPLVTAFPALEAVCLTPSFRQAVEEEPSLPAALLEVARYFAEGSRRNHRSRRLCWRSHGILRKAAARIVICASWISRMWIRNSSSGTEILRRAFFLRCIRRAVSRISRRSAGICIGKYILWSRISMCALWIRR